MLIISPAGMYSTEQLIASYWLLSLANLEPDQYHNSAYVHLKIRKMNKNSQLGYSKQKEGGRSLVMNCNEYII